NFTALASAQRSPDGDVDAIDNKGIVAVAVDYVDAASMPTASGHHTRPGRRADRRAGNTPGGLDIANSTHDHIGFVGVGRTPGRESTGATPPAKAAQIVGLPLDHLRSHQGVGCAIGNLAERHLRLTGWAVPCVSAIAIVIGMVLAVVL